MGGYSSGRYGWRGVIESRRRLDIRQAKRRGWLRPGRSGNYSWMQNGEPCGSVTYTVRDDALELQYAIVSDEDQRTPVQIRIPILSVPCRFGGERRYWHCPRCWRRCEVVVLASHARGWGCRRCLRLRYCSQGLAPRDRAQRRAEQLYARAGVENNEGIVCKYKWMRWRTYRRLMDHANAMSGVADAAFIYRAMRLTGMR